MGRTQAEASGGNLLSPRPRQMLTNFRLSRYRLRRSARRDSRLIPKLGARHGHRDERMLADFYFLGFITWFGLRVHLFVLTCHMLGCVLCAFRSFRYSRKWLVRSAGWNFPTNGLWTIKTGQTKLYEWFELLDSGIDRSGYTN